MKKHTSYLQLIGLIGIISVIQITAADIGIFVAPAAPPAVRIAAQDLASKLKQIYPKDSFPVAAQEPATSEYIKVAVQEQSAAESFTISTVNQGNHKVGLIQGGSARGAVYGVYALLRKLGCGFYLSGDTLPPARQDAFSFVEFALSDRPLVADRLVFDWHNFISGCSTWNLKEWNQWTDQSQKMGYNAIMVHAYGNNPMVCYEFNGQRKPVGFLSTTIKGRDWSTMHVNDVRRLFGGQVFDSPAFGAEAALVPDEQRVDAAEKLMHGVFAHAAERAMGVYMAVDVDTGSANPQEVIQTLPESARFTISAQAGGLSGVSGEGSRAFWLANPDSPEGYRFYKTQVETLLKVYPQITTLVAWFRQGGTPWLEIKLTEFPPAWQTEYQAALAKTPKASNYWHAPHMFAIGKIVRAFDRALKETGHEKVALATGTWDFKFLPGADLFMPPHVKLIGLDYNVLHERPQLGDAESRKPLAEVGAHRPVLPVVWAHHDDGHYIGRPYTPFPDFYSKLTDAKACGFGIIHWTTRPLDIYFASHAEQVWQSSKDKPLQETAADMAQRLFGSETRQTMGDYLYQWATKAPRFARETSDWFIDRPLTNITEVVEGCQQRLKTINAVNQNQLTASGRENLEYYKGLEEFIAAFHLTHGKYQDAQNHLKNKNIPAARQAMTECQPEPVIEQFARFSTHRGITRGEQGLVISQNLRWLTHLTRLRQTLGLEPVRINFAPTQHDKLAQSRGTFTFFFDDKRSIWECWGEEETQSAIIALPAAKALAAGLPDAYTEICKTAITSDKPLSFTLRPIMARDSRGRGGPAGLLPGDYQLHLILLDPESTTAGQRTFAMALETTSTGGQYTFDAVKANFLRVLCKGNSENDWNSINEVQLDALAQDKGSTAVTCSSAVSGYPAALAADGKPETRWAARGTNQWLQFKLESGATVNRIGLQWFGNEKRKAQFELLASQDGKQWQPVTGLKSGSESQGINDQLDIFAIAGQPGKVVEKIYPIKLGQSGNLRLTFTPTKGKLLVGGLILEPISTGAK
jgi:hypothetical protein